MELVASFVRDWEAEELQQEIEELEIEEESKRKGRRREGIGRRKGSRKKGKDKSNAEAAAKKQDDQSIGQSASEANRTTGGTMDVRQNKTFRKIEQDLKNKQKRRQKEALEGRDENAPREESYVDKNRAIGVSSGDDLKGSIMRHRGKLLDKNAIFSEFDINVLIEQAIHEMRYGDAQKALSYLEKGIYIRPDNLDCLVLKATCLVNLNRFSEALEDADQIIKEPENRYNSRALIVKGDALYNLGNFEHALVNYHRAKKNAKIKEKHELELRLMRTEMALSNAVGPSASVYFKHLEKFLFKIPTNIMGLPFFKLQKVMESSSAKNKFQDKKFLGDLASDKYYLEGILTKLSTQTTLKTEARSKIKKEAQGALNYLIERRDFWAQQNPDYPEIPEEVITEKPTWKLGMQRMLKRRNHEKQVGQSVNMFSPYG